MGAFLLARDRQFSAPLSIFVALVVSLNGWIISWGATDWFGALGAFTWLPWAWWGAARALDSQRSKWRFLLAGAVCLPRRDRRISLHGFDATALGRMVGNQVAGRDSKHFVGCASALWRGTWLRVIGPRVARDSRFGSGFSTRITATRAHWQWLVPPAALPGLILPCWTVNWADFSNHYLPHTATELACGLVAPAALIAGLAWRGRVLVRQIKWELALLLLVLLLSMIPTAGLFRWSFRWLPFFHLVLAICAAEVLHLRAGITDPGYSGARSHRR